MSYALKPGELAQALASEAPEISWTLCRNRTGLLFECFFWPPNANVPHERLYLRSGAVPSAEAAKARTYVSSVVLMEFRGWLNAILSAPANSTLRREQQHFARSLPGVQNAV
jgi:hypothetical protein